MNHTQKLDNIDAVELYASGKNLRYIADLAGCRESTVSLYLRNHNVKIRPRGVPALIHPVGTQINNWLVVSDKTISAGTSHGVKQDCECQICGYRAFVYLNSTGTRKSLRCQKCKSSKIRLDDGNIDIEYVIRYYFERHCVRNINRRKKVSSLGFHLSFEYVLNLYKAQNGKCAISGMSLIGDAVSLAELPLSLDRIDSNKGYVEGNVQWVHKDVNMMKQSYSNERFIGICCMIALHQSFNSPCVCALPLND